MPKAVASFLIDKEHAIFRMAAVPGPRKFISHKGKTIDGVSWSADQAY